MSYEFNIRFNGPITNVIINTNPITSRRTPAISPILQRKLGELILKLGESGSIESYEVQKGRILENLSGFRRTVEKLMGILAEQAMLHTPLPDGFKDRLCPQIFNGAQVCDPMCPDIHTLELLYAVKLKDNPFFKAKTHLCQYKFVESCPATYNCAFSHDGDIVQEQRQGKHPFFYYSQLKLSAPEEKEPVVSEPASNLNPESLGRSLETLEDLRGYLESIYPYGSLEEEVAYWEAHPDEFVDQIEEGKRIVQAFSEHCEIPKLWGRAICRPYWACKNPSFCEDFHQSRIVASYILNNWRYQGRYKITDCQYKKVKYCGAKYHCRFVHAGEFKLVHNKENVCTGIVRRILEKPSKDQPMTLPIARQRTPVAPVVITNAEPSRTVTAPGSLNIGDIVHAVSVGRSALETAEENLEMHKKNYEQGRWSFQEQYQYFQGPHAPALQEIPSSASNIKTYTFQEQYQQYLHFQELREHQPRLLAPSSRGSDATLPSIQEVPEEEAPNVRMSAFNVESPAPSSADISRRGDEKE